MSSKTIKVYLAGVRNLHITHGDGDPFVGCERLRLQLRGIKRSKGRYRRYMFPFSPANLKKARSTCFHKLRVSQPQRVLWAAVTLAYFGLLRCSEYAPTTPSKFDPQRQLTVSDVTFYPDRVNPNYMTVFISQSKTDPFRHGQLVTVGATSNELCPVRAMKNMIEGDTARTREPTSPLFTQAGGKPLSRSTVVATIKRMAKACGLPVSSYSSHSLRRGGASALWAAGFSREQVMLMGRWLSNAYILYVAEPHDRLAGAAARMASVNLDPTDKMHTSDWGSSEM